MKKEKTVCPVPTVKRARRDWFICHRAWLKALLLLDDSDLRKVLTVIEEYLEGKEITSIKFDRNITPIAYILLDSINRDWETCDE